MKRFLIITAIAALGLIFAGCDSSASDRSEDTSASSPAVEVASDGAEGAEADDTANTADTEDKNLKSEAKATPGGTSETDAKETADETAEVPAEDSEDTTTAGPDDDTPVKGQPIVWLGDSLTQGSLGDDNDNLAGAPYEKLKTLVDVPVEGHGFYGWNTHDVLWAYTAKEQLGQIADPHKTYIFWLGSNDWVVDGEPNTDTAPVIKEIDRFLHLEGNIPNYIVIGTTSRHRLKDLYLPINADLEEHYKEHYMDVIDIINWYGYSPDKTHLSQECYDAVAEAVYEKLKDLGYI